MSEIGPTRVFVDANVLYSRTIRDWLCLLLVETSPPIFYLYWSEDVLAEVMYRLRKNNPNWSGDKTTHVHDSLIKTLSIDMRVSDYAIDPNFSGPDPHDAHVHSAAIACGASYLLTCNLQDFNPHNATLPYEPIHPDSFLCLVNESGPHRVRAVTRKQMDYWARKRPEAKLQEYLRRADCPMFAEQVARHVADIGGVPYLFPSP